MPYVIDFRNVLRKMEEVFPLKPDTFLKWLNEGRGAASEERNEEVQRRLQAYVDTWLATGRGHNPARPDEESPSLRGYCLTSTDAANKEAITHTSNLLFRASSTEFTLAVLLHRAFCKLLPASGARNADFEAFQWGMARISTSTGGWQRYLGTSRVDFDFEEDPQPCPKDADFAGRLFTLLMLGADWRNEIAKCRYHACGIYFRLPSTKTRVNGCFCCPEHYYAVVGKERSSQIWKAAAQRTLQHAAEKYKEWLNCPAKWQKQNPAKEWIKNEVNLFIAQDRARTRNAIKVNWVTLHWNEIASGSIRTVGRARRPTIKWFRATPLSINIGESAVLSWSVRGAVRSFIDQHVGDVTGKTSISVWPMKDTAYTLTAIGPGGDIAVATVGGPA